MLSCPWADSLQTYIPHRLIPFRFFWCSKTSKQKNPTLVGLFLSRKRIIQKGGKSAVVVFPKFGCTEYHRSPGGKQTHKREKKRASSRRWTIRKAPRLEKENVRFLRPRNPNMTFLPPFFGGVQTGDPPPFVESKWRDICWWELKNNYTPTFERNGAWATGIVNKQKIFFAQGENGIPETSKLFAPPPLRWWKQNSFRGFFLRSLRGKRGNFLSTQ